MFQVCVRYAVFARHSILFLLPIMLNCTDTSPVLLHTHSFGPVRQDEILEHTFSLRNPTRVPWEITRIASSCGCTVASTAELRQIPAGTTVLIPVRMDTQGKVGKVVNTVYLNIRELAEAIELKVDAEIEREYPQDLELVVSGIAPACKQFTLAIPNSVDPYRISSIDYDSSA